MRHKKRTQQTATICFGLSPARRQHIEQVTQIDWTQTEISTAESNLTTDSIDIVPSDVHNPDLSMMPENEPTLSERVGK